MKKDRVTSEEIGIKKDWVTSEEIGIKKDWVTSEENKTINRKSFGDLDSSKDRVTAR